MTPSYLNDFAAQIAGVSGEKELAGAIKAVRREHCARWTPQTSGRTWMHEHAALLDIAVRRLFAVAGERTSGDEPSAPVAIIATGGYGQKLLAPHSDLDLTFLTARDDNSPFLHTLFQLTMDVLLSGAKIKIGYAYRTLRELSEPGGVSVLDHQTQTALLDARFIAGDAALLVHFDQLVQTSLHVAEFLFFKEAERVRVRGGLAGAKDSHPTSPFVAAPNVKEGPGGLRDLQTAAWMARVRWNQKGDPLWRDLVRRKIITKADLKALSASRDFLLTVRCALHIEAGERRDTLTPPRQEAVARALLFLDAPEPVNGAFVRPGVEAFMERYYHSAFHIDRLWHKIKTRCLEAPLPLGPSAPGLSCVKGRVMITDPEQAAQNPLWPLAALAFCQTHGLELAPSAREAIEVFRTGTLWNDAETRKQAGRDLVGLLSLPGDAGQTVRGMEETGLLADFLPDLAACMNLVPYDPSHTTTVGEHSIRVLENLLRLRDTAGNAAGENENAPYYAALREIDNPAPLFLAALLHDVGKKRPVLKNGTPAHHAETGAEIAWEACARLGCDRQTTETVHFLIQNHLKLAEVSRLRDLTLTRTIAEVADLTGDPIRLRMLYLLTWADTQAVGPGVWNERVSRLLSELFARTDAYFAAAAADFASQTPPLNETDRLNTVRERLQRKLIMVPSAPLLLPSPRPKLRPSGKAVEDGDWDDLPPDAVHAHMEAMPAAYLLGTPPDTIALHLRLIAQWKKQNVSIHEPFDFPVLDMRVVPPDTDQTALTVVTGDDPAPGLLAKITGVLLACDVRLHAAQVWTRLVSADNENSNKNAEAGERRVALDTLFVDFHDRPLGPQLRRTVADNLFEVLTGQVMVSELLEKKRRSVENGLPPLRIMQADDQISLDYTLLDVEASDDRGTLYRFARVFSGWGWNIHAARVSRWGGKARYAFYLADANGTSLGSSDLSAFLTSESKKSAKP